MGKGEFQKKDSKGKKSALSPKEKLAKKRAKKNA